MKKIAENTLKSSNQYKLPTDEPLQQVFSNEFSELPFEDSSISKTAASAN
jgi:hypothetical protein